MEYAYICQTCGVQQAPTVAPPASCPICADERQYIGHSGQHWLTYPELRSTHRNVIKLEEPGLYGIGVEPKFAIGQRALLLQTASGNILWDCVPLLDDTTFATIQAMGGLSAIRSLPSPFQSRPLWSGARRSAASRYTSMKRTGNGRCAQTQLSNSGPGRRWSWRRG